MGVFKFFQVMAKKCSRHGGARFGSGRKARPALREIRDRAARILHGVFEDEAAEEHAWSKLLNHKDPSIKLRALVELSKLAYPPPKQLDANVAGPLTIIFEGPQPEWAKPSSPAPRPWLSR